jgi:DNA recombination protein RmuC
MEPFQLLFFLATLMFVAGTAITLVRKKLLKNHAQEIGKLSISIEGKENENQLLKQQNSQIKQDFAVLSAENREREKSNLEKITLLKDAENSLKIKFENLANQIFTENQKKLKEANKESVETLLHPVRQQLTDFRKKVEDIYDNENRERASLRTEINILKNLNERIGNDALNLTRALKGDSKVRGDWGELQLERLLEESGLVKGREYDTQTAYKNTSGKSFLPDAIIHLPNNKHIIIDSKVSLVAYDRHHGAEDEVESKIFAKEHVASMRNHIKELSEKKYEKLVGLNSLELVIMFVPIEPALGLAVSKEPTIWADARKKQIIIAGPNTLMLALLVVNNLWQTEKQALNAEKIAADAANLYDKFASFLDDMEKVGSSIENARKVFDEARKKLTTGNGSLTTRVEKFRELGVNPKKSIPAKWLPEDDHDTEISYLHGQIPTEEKS